MNLLLLSLLLFGLVHVGPAIPALKARAVALLGKVYGAVYGLLSTLLLVLAVYAVRVAEPGFLYMPPDWGRHANYAFTLVGFLCLGIFLFRGSWRNRLRYPMAIGVVFWAVGHLLANGETAAVIFFTGFAAFAILHAVLKARLGGFQPSDERQGHNTLSLFAGLALYGLMTQLHFVLIGKALVELN